jgi:uncharacterized damage-inducible protein DinB
MSNPYADSLASQDARAVLASTPGLLHQAACRLSPEQIEAPIAPGKWSVRQIVAHLADCEIAFSFRLRQALAGPQEGHSQVIIQPFDQDAWSQHYANYDLASALTLFHALREWNLKLVGGLSKAELASETHHPERGSLTFQTILDTMAGHDLNHLKQVQQVAAAH